MDDQFGGSVVPASRQVWGSVVASICFDHKDHDSTLPAVRSSLMACKGLQLVLITFKFFSDFCDCCQIGQLVGRSSIDESDKVGSD